LIEWILQQLEKQPSTLFYETALRERNEADFLKLKEKKLLTYVQPNSVEEVYSKGQQEPKIAVNLGGRYAVLDDKSPETGLLFLDRADLAKYCFSFETFAKELAFANHFSGSPEKLHRRLYYAGERNIGGSRVAMVLAFIDQDKSAENLLLGLPGHFPSRFNQFYVVTPSYSVKSIPLSDKLSRCQIYVGALQDFDTLKVDLSILTEQTSILTPQQEKDYEQYQYKCRQAIDITGETTPVGNNKVTLGDIPVELGDIPFLLFLRLVLEFKRDKWGIVSTVVLMDEGYLGDNEHQAVLRLRERFKPTLLSLKPSINPNEFIERFKPKTLRLSIHPDLVICNLERLLEHDDSRVKELVEQLSQIPSANSPQPI